MVKTRIGRNQAVCLGLVVAVLLALGASRVFADIKLPAIIGDDMVLQQGKAVAIWGWADPDEEIMVSASWQSMQWGVKADKDGKWRFNVTSPKAGGPYEITLKGKNTITIRNILVGEVWVGSGQSNMQMSVQSSANSQEEIAAAKYPRIRLFSVEREVADKPKDDCKGRWIECSPESVPGFSAAAYFFGRELHKELGIPIGLIHTSWGGTPAEAWTTREMLDSDDDFKPILIRFDEAVAKYPQAKADYDEKIKQWQEAAKKAKAEGTNPPGRPGGPPFGPGNPHSPAGLYNAMIAPLIPYGIQGAIWYQGESNAGRS
ncbi:MAG: hypothetical protein JXN61_10975, partial [Sedimentisphaerales bacterium]|nr:hypothetical protein [Sedimentisphaerales bacterium]